MRDKHKYYPTGSTNKLTLLYDQSKSVRNSLFILSRPLFGRNFILSRQGKEVQGMERIDTTLIEQIHISYMQIFNRVELLGLHEKVSSLSSQVQQFVYCRTIEDRFVLMISPGYQTL